MDKVTGRLLVFFEEPFWIGIFERVEEGTMSVCKVSFGAEPKDYEVHQFILENYDKLRFSPSVDSKAELEERINPKRLQRKIRKQVQNVGMGTKSQQALKLQQEQGKMERKTRSRKWREDEKARRFQLKQQKKKEKHRGR